MTRRSPIGRLAELQDVGQLGVDAEDRFGEDRFMTVPMGGHSLEKHDLRQNVGLGANSLAFDPAGTRSVN